MTQLLAFAIRHRLMARGPCQANWRTLLVVLLVLGQGVSLAATRRGSPAGTRAPAGSRGAGAGTPRRVAARVAPAAWPGFAPAGPIEAGPVHEQSPATPLDWQASVQAVLQIGTDVYIGGQFTQVAGGVRAASIAHWNGRTWAALGSGLRRRCNSDDSHCGVAALAAAPNGDIYAGGNFIEAGGQPVLGLARWDGRAWHPVGTDLGGSIGALAVASNGDLYVAGRLYMGDSLAEKWGGDSFCVAEETVAKWDGRTWQLLGGGPVGEVWALAVGKRGEVYAGGSIVLYPGGLSYPMGCRPAYDVARWDGRRWHSLGAGIDSSRTFAQPTVCALAVTPAGDLYAGGDFRIAGGQPANGLARWDGRDWHPVGKGPGVDGYVRSLALTPAGELYATGLFRQAGVAPATAVACWNGTAWQALGGGLNGEGCALALGGTGGVVVGGMFSQAGGLPAAGVARWGGRDWSLFGAGTSTGGFATALATGPKGTVYLSGFLAAPPPPLGREVVVDGHPYFLPDNYYHPPGDAVVTHRLARWDSTAWHPLGPGRASEVTGCVTALAATSRRTLYAGGTFSAIGGKPACNVARWNGHAWHALGGGLGDSASAVTALAVAANGELYAAGFFATAGGRPAHGLARWNGRTWSQVGTGLATASVTALALTAQGTVYAAGHFSPTDPIGAAQLARWDGTAWVVVATTPRPVTITALAVAANGDLYAGATTGAFKGSLVVRWDGSAWRSLPGSHALDEHILALSIDGGAALFLGGDFSEIRRFGLGIGPLTNAPGAPPGRAFQRLGQGLTDARLYPALRPPRRRRRSSQPPPPVTPPDLGQGW